MIKNKLYKLGLIIVISFFTMVSCEFEEPFTSPKASFDILSIDPGTGYKTELNEPYVLNLGETYSFEITGEGEQHVFWFGEPADSGKTNGSTFIDRGINHNSRARKVKDNKLLFSYTKIGTFDLVCVSSSYRYSDDHYEEDLLSKTILIPDTVK